MSIEKAIKERLKELLTLKNMSVYKLYTLSGVPKSTVYETINGNDKRITVSTLAELCATLDISLTEFFNSPLFKDIV